MPISRIAKGITTIIGLSWGLKISSTGFFFKFGVGVGVGVGTAGLMYSPLRFDK